MNDPAALDGQTVLVVGGSSGIGRETARQVRLAGADVILTAREPDRLYRAGLELGARIAAFDATDLDRLAEFFRLLDGSVDHLLISGPVPCSTERGEVASRADGRELAQPSLLSSMVRSAAVALRSTGSLLFLGPTSERSADRRRSSPLALAAVTREFALQLAPVRVNSIAIGFVDTPHSAAVWADDFDARRDHLRAILPIRRVVTAPDVASLAVHVMVNGALTGSTFDIDGGQQLVEG